MKLICNVDINNRLLPSLNIASRRKPQRSSLAIAKHPGKKNDLCIFHQSSQNKLGTKYKVENNIENIFTRFIDDGRATIRVIEPAHDIIIQSDPIQLKCFIRILKLGIQKKVDLAVLGISNLNPKSILPKAKTKFVIKSAAEYPILAGFPRTTEELHIVGLQRRSFDRQILKLQSLRVLNLSENNITSLPVELGSLANLSELVLNNNQLGKIPISKWTWMNGVKITQNLRLLDLSSNNMLVLPPQIGKLISLVTLKLDSNMLETLPQSIGSLKNLRYLGLSRNKLACLPGSMRSLRLESLDISQNYFSHTNQHVISKIGVPSLVEIAARLSINLRQRYDASIIPYTLVRYLDEAQYCVCGGACFESFVRRALPLDVQRISASVTSSNSSLIQMDCYFCSMKCLQRHAKVP